MIVGRAPLEHRARRRSVSRLVHRKNRQIEAHGIIFHLAVWERLAGRTFPDAALGIDPSPRMIEHARDAERRWPSGAVFSVDDGCTLATVATGSVDWVTAGLSLNNVPDLDAALTAVRRVLTSGGGSLVFTIPHPCFEAPRATWTETEDGAVHRVVGDYLTEGFWRSANPEGARRAGNQHRTLSTYLTALVGHGFRVEAVHEPAPDAKVATAQPQRAGLPPFMVLHARQA
ncbi:class I SAM-dependent methyltransferase [Streptomyces sp. NBC_01602]|uniref:class I SAM-dependent methyltransferase n=1 Tax=Streptomyces sp. NBC_01602 TaxID=2975893 RepID=UPI00386380FD